MACLSPTMMQMTASLETMAEGDLMVAPMVVVVMEKVEVEEEEEEEEELEQDEKSLAIRLKWKSAEMPAAL